MIHLKLQKLQKGDYTTAHRLNVNVLLSNITFFAFFAVLDVTFIFAVLLHFCSCYVCSGYGVRGTLYVIRILFEVLP